MAGRSWLARHAVPVLLRGFGSAAAEDTGALRAWEERLRKEAKGKDPYEAFGSTNADVSDVGALGGLSPQTHTTCSWNACTPPSLLV